MSESEPRPKRHKIGIACDMCRARKVKCDGSRPACNNCRRRLAKGDRCNYSDSTLMATPTSQRVPRTPVMSEDQTQPPPYGSPLLFRFGSTGGTSSGLVIGPVPAGPAGPPTTATGAGSTSSSNLADSMTVVVEEGMQTLQYFGSSSAGWFTRQIKEAIDASMGAPSPMSGVGIGTLGDRMTGSTVASVSMNDVLARSANDVRDDIGNTNYNAHYDLDADTNDDDNDNDHDAGLELLPRRREADHLVGLYWRYVDPLYPFLDRQTWTPAYEALFDGQGKDDPDDRIFVSTLNVIFALSTQLSERWPSQSPRDVRPSSSKEFLKILRQRERQGRVYFARAQKLLQRSLWDATGSLATVQFLLLASQYLQSTNNPHQTWMVVGSTIRTAQSLGLHLPDAANLGANGADFPQSEDRELRRRLWHGCVLMDRMVSITHGRPVMISPELCAMIPLPRCASQEPDGHYQGVPNLSFFIKSVELYEIMNQVISAFYSAAASVGAAVVTTTETAAPPIPPDEDLAKVLKLDDNLLVWERGLPSYLRYDLLNEAEAREQSRADCKPRQAVILHVRFLQARMLLLRPVAAKFCLDANLAVNTATLVAASSLRSRIKRDVFTICVETAKAMIDVLEQYRPQEDKNKENVSRSSSQSDGIGLLPAWWYRVYYLYSAASILVVAKLRRDIFPPADIQRAWDKAILLLEGHKRFGLSAHRCLAALDILSGKRGGGGQQHELPQQKQNQQHFSRSQHNTTEQGNSENGHMGGDGLAMHLRANLQHTNNNNYHHQSPFADFDFAGLSFDVQAFSDLNMHAWEFLNQP